MAMSVGDSQNSVPQLGFFAMRDAGASGSSGEGNGAGVVVGDDGVGDRGAVDASVESAEGTALNATLPDATRNGDWSAMDVFPTILGVLTRIHRHW